MNLHLPTSILAAATIILLPATTPLFAARAILTMSRVKEADATIVLATIRNPQQVERRNPHDPERTDKGFRFRLEINEVVRPGKLGKDVREIDIPFSHSGYGTPWEFENEPKDRMEILTFLVRSEDGTFDILGVADVIVSNPRPGFIEAIRKLDEIWRVEDPKQRLQATLAGAKSDNRDLRVFCLRAIAWSDSQQSGIDLTKTISRKESLARMWELYTDPKASWESVEIGDNLFWNLYRGEGWGTFEPRYAVLAGVVRRAVAAKEEIQHNAFDYLVVHTCRYPNHARESIALLEEILANGAPIYRFGTTMRYSILYQPHARDPAQQKLNADIVKALAKHLTNADSSIADGAAVAIGEIAEQSVRLGPIPAETVALLRGDSGEKIHADAKSRLDQAWGEYRKMPKVKLPDDTQPFAFPWESSLDKKVAAVGRMAFRDSPHGTNVEIGGQRLWVEAEGLSDETVRGGTIIRVTGRLTRRNDLNRFVYRPGQPWGEGLPVANEAELKTSRERYVLVDAKWEEVKP